MLEKPALKLVPWNDARPLTDRNIPDIDRPIRAVFDAASGAYLGLVRRRIDHGPGWLRFFTRPIVEVFETADESLIFTIRQSWLLHRWQVCDAEGKLIGTVRRSRVRGQGGTSLARLERSGGDRGCMRAADGRQLGMVFLQDGTMVAEFASEPENGNPFVKMNLLAMLLVGLTP